MSNILTNYLRMISNIEFTSKVYLPILKETVRFRNLNNNHYFDILKFITNNDDEGLNEYFENLIFTLIVNKSIYSNLSNLEKFLILLDLRSISVGDQLQITGSNSIKVDLSLMSIKNSINDKILASNFKNVLTFDKNCTISLSIPKIFFVDDIDKIYIEIIDNIKIDEEVIDFYHLTNEEKLLILDKIPATTSGDILKFITNTQNVISNINIISENEKFGLEAIKLSVFDKTMFMFLKSIFTDDLYNYYELQFNLSNKMNVSYDHFMKMSPNECKLFINFYNKEMKKQEEAQQKQGGSFSSLPSMPSIPKFK